MSKITAKEKAAKENLFRKSEEPSGIPIKGYDFNKGINYENLIKSFSSTGFQASHLSKAIEITNNMIKDNAFIFLGYTSNMVSSGIREILRYLVQHKKINLIVTTAGAIEEDIIKCLGPFILGDFRASGSELRKKGINRIGNIYAPNNRYVAFEEFIQPLLKELHEKQKPLSPSYIISKLGEKINNEESICYWAYKNNIPILCPALTDGALGDNIYFYSLNNPGFTIDIVEDTKKLNNSTLGLKK